MPPTASCCPALGALGLMHTCGAPQPCTAAEYLQPLMTSTGRRYPADGLIYMAAGEAPGFGKQTAQLQTPLIVVSVGSLSFQCSVPRGILDEVLQEDELAKVDNFALRSFVEVLLASNVRYNSPSSAMLATCCLCNVC
eukprot:CAMPEP_0206149484 /NCGR_PEP_ID=MMETSP1473-20131121/37805_1 /ASSEMBLY_ACC=CAM_ASM_001109 /TAXON_ID=1461547 /ORGANISM="Stichococcus sp, Strain RCC1054" /LENGTH=137 /DNA_ID=CAMNT_0053546949 /DNA_START=175 /DNA_END=588 /DNA_ORIENTATION=+